MATTSALLPIIGYALLAILLAYLAYRLIAHRRNGATLPRPVLGSATRSFARTTGWDWRRWTLPIPWTRPAAKVKPTKVKAPKADLLPTTGLPPPPTTPQLVEITPPTPPHTASNPTSPRTPSPSHQQLHPHTLMTHKVLHPSYPRPTSPHALLATTSPQKHHRRSSSLGGVPVRRLSGGNSGLRNKVDLDVELRDFVPGHTRGTSREHLLIDFSSSGSSEEEGQGHGPDSDISPAVSDIGVLPASHSNVVNTRPVPLVDLGDDDETNAKLHTSEDDSWKWFGPGTPSSVRMYTPHPVPQRVQAWAATTTERAGALLHGQGKPGFPIPMPFSFPKSEKLVDVHTDDDEQELVAFASSKTLVDIDDADIKSQKAHEFQPEVVHIHHENTLADIRPPELVDLREAQAGLGDKELVDPFGDEYRVDATLVDITVDKHDHKSQPSAHVSPLPLPTPPSTHLVEQASTAAERVFHHPLEAFMQVDIIQPQKELNHEDVQPDDGLLFAEVGQHSEHKSEHEQDAEQEHDAKVEHEGLESDGENDPSTTQSPSLSPLIPAHAPVFDFASESESAQAQVYTQQRQPLAGWNWDEVEDPWGDHVVVADDHDDDDDVSLEVKETAINSDFINFEHNHERGHESEVDALLEVPISTPNVEDVVEKSPGGSLLPTLLDNEEGEEEEVPMLVLDADLEVQHPQTLDQTHEKEQVEEEDATPKPTPASVKAELPTLVIDIPSVSGLPVIVVDDEKEAQSLTDKSTGKEEYPDPELLPLPLPALLLSLDAHLEEGVTLGTCNDKPNECSDKSNAAPSMQTPTPPASPPPMSPLRVLGSGSGSGSGGSSPVSPRPSPNAGSTSALKSLPPSPRVGSKNLSVAGAGEVARSRPASPRLALALPPPPPTKEEEKEDNETPVALVRPLWAVGLAERVERKREAAAQEVAQAEAEERKESSEGEKETESEVHAAAAEMKLSSSLPGSFPESESESAPAPAPTSSTSTSVSTTTTTTTIAARLASAAGPALFRPSARTIVRSPLDIALAMQLRPGLGAGADPAWMVRFLMAMFGWLAVVVSGQGEF